MAADPAISIAVRGLARSVGTMAAALAQRIRRIALAVGHRRALAQLADRDDRLLADIGLARGDVAAAHSAPPWRDPTEILVARRRRSSTIFHQERDQ